MGDRKKSLDGAYLQFLCDLVQPKTNKNPQRTYGLLLERMHLRDFLWSIPHDDNRIEDGLELRQEFLQGRTGVSGPCSFLEVLIALSRRVAFESYGDTDEWFWHLAGNLGLQQYSDEHFMDLEPYEVDEILDRVIHREYQANGDGGLFPVSNPYKDQRKVELWYQMSSYILEERGP